MKTCDLAVKGSHSDFEQSTEKPHVPRHCQKQEQSQRQKNRERQKLWSYLSQTTEQQTSQKFTRETWQVRKPWQMIINFHKSPGFWKAVWKCKAAHILSRDWRRSSLFIFLSPKFQYLSFLEKYSFSKNSISSKTILRKLRQNKDIAREENSLLSILHKHPENREHFQAHSTRSIPNAEYESYTMIS